MGVFKYRAGKESEPPFFSNRSLGTRVKKSARGLISGIRTLAQCDQQQTGRIEQAGKDAERMYRALRRYSHPGKCRAVPGSFARMEKSGRNCLDTW